MKNFAYARRENKELYIYQYRDSIPTESSAFAGLMMNRLDFDVKILEIPPVGEEEIENLLNYRLRSIYPGDPENTRFDYRVIARGRKRYAVLFITSKANMLRYRELAGTKALLLPYTIIESHLKSQKGDKCIYLFWDHDWLDVLIFEGNLLISSTAIKREKELFLDILKVRNILPKNYPEYKSFIMSLAEEHNEITEKTRELYKNVESKEYLSIDVLLANIVPKTDSLFRKKLPINNIAKKIRVDVLMLPIILLICLLFNSYVEQRISYKRLLEKTHADKIQKSQSQLSFQALQNELDAIRKKQPKDTYFHLSELAGKMGGDVIASTFTVHSDGTFIMDCEALRASAYDKAFTDNKFIKDVVINDVKVDPDKHKEKFRFTGVFNVNQ